MSPSESSAARPDLGTDESSIMQRYAMATIEMSTKVDAEVVAASRALKVLEGVWGGNWTVVIKFPSMAVAETWHRSPEYQPLKAIRVNEVTTGGHAVFVEGFNPAALGL